MTVAELIEVLQRHDQTEHVMLVDDDNRGNMWSEATSVYEMVDGSESFVVIAL